MLLYDICLWLTSLNMTISRSSHVAANDIILLFFMTEKYSIVYMYHIFFIHSSADGHLGCFYVLASALLTAPKPLTVGITTNCGKFFKRWDYQTTLPASWETCMHVKKQQLKPEMELQTGSKLGKENIKVVYCHPAFLTYIQSASCEMLGWMKHKLESKLPGEISITSDKQMIPPSWQKAKRN